MKNLFITSIFVTSLLTTKLFGQFANTPTQNTADQSTGGKVGIGTGAPAGKLEILDNVNQLRLSNSSSIFSDINTSSAGHLVFQPGTASGKIAFGISAPASGVGFHSNMGVFRFTENGSSRGFQVSPNYPTANGDIPVGTLIQSLVSTTNEGLSIIATGAGTSGVKLGAYAYSSSGWKSMWETANVTGVGVLPNLALAKSGGNVGIGTSSPAAKLSIANGANETGNYGKALQITNLDGNRQQMAFVRAGMDVLAAGYNGSTHVWGFGIGQTTDANFSPSMLSLDLGTQQIGIGTTTPGAKLDVNGYAKFVGLSSTVNQTTDYGFNQTLNVTRNLTKALGVFNTTDPVSTEKFIVWGSGRTDIKATTKTDKYFVINDVSIPASPVESFAVSGNGYIKINITNPVAMDNVFDIYDVTNNLQLFRVKYDGHVFAREVEIRPTSQSFPDYVFEKNYNLLPLSEVEKFIKNNKHLPGYEKGTYYEENGIKSSEMFIKQQEKIEELTLYIIELEKRLNSLEKTIKN
ncbi:MAG: hypothetical protein HY062_11095 [Bacteroidetes bacterium]|nr:hypothetical protein [Bacteroidota bacterium]